MTTKHADDLSTEANAQAAADLKQRKPTPIAARTGVAAQVAPKVPFAMHLVPQDVDDVQAFDFARNAEVEADRQQALIDAELAAQANDLLFFLACKRHRLGRSAMQQNVDLGPHHGLYFVKPPMAGGEIGMHDWYFRGKKAEDTWHQPLYCQECAVHGQNVLLAYRMLDFAKGVWVPDPKMIWCLPKDPAWYEKVGPFRAVDTSFAAANTGRAEALAKLAALRAQKAG